MLNHRFVLNTSHVIIDGLFESIPILLSFMVIAFGASEKETGMIISLAIMGNTLLGLFTICFSRYWGVLRTVSLIILLYGAGFFINAFSQNLLLTGLCFIIAIAGHSVFHNIALAHLTATSDRCSLGKAMGTFTAIGDLGRVPFTSLAGFVAAVSIFGFAGWRIVCVSYGLGAICYAGYLFFFPFHRGEKNKEEPLTIPAVKKPFPTFSLLRNRQFRLPITANILDAVGSDQIFTFLPYLLFTKGIEPTIMGTFALVFTCGCFLGKIVCGSMVDRFGTRRVFVIAEVIMALLLVILVVGQDLFIIIGASFLLGIVTKGTIPVIQTIVTEPIGEKQHYDDIFAISTFSRGTTNMLTPLLFGFVASVFGINWIYSIMAIAAMGGILPVLQMDKTPYEVHLSQPNN